MTTKSLQRYKCKDKYGNEVDVIGATKEEAYKQALQYEQLQGDTIIVKDKDGNTTFFSDDYDDDDEQLQSLIDEVVQFNEMTDKPPIDINDSERNRYHCKDATGYEIDVIASTPKKAWKQALAHALLIDRHLLQYPVSIDNKDWYYTYDEPPFNDINELESYRKWLSDVNDMIMDNQKRLQQLLLKKF